MVSSAIKLSEYDITFESRSTIKSHLLADFLVEFTSSDKEFIATWILSVEGSSNLKGTRQAKMLVRGGGRINNKIGA